MNMRVLTQLSGLFVGCKPCQIDLSFSEKKKQMKFCVVSAFSKKINEKATSKFGLYARISSMFTFIKNRFDLSGHT